MTTTITPKHGGRFVVPQKENEMAITDQERATYKKWAEGFPTTSGYLRTGKEVAIGKLLDALEAAEARAETAEGQREQVMRQKANLETERAALVREVQIYTDRHVRIMSKAEELLEICRKEVMGHTDYTAAHSDGYESALVAILDEMKESSAQEVARQAAGKEVGE